MTFTRRDFHKEGGRGGRETVRHFKHRRNWMYKIKLTRSSIHWHLFLWLDKKCNLARDFLVIQIIWPKFIRKFIFIFLSCLLWMCWGAEHPLHLIWRHYFTSLSFSLSRHFDCSHGVQSDYFARVGQLTDGSWGFDDRVWSSMYFLCSTLVFLPCGYWRLGRPLGKFALLLRMSPTYIHILYLCSKFTV